MRGPFSEEEEQEVRLIGRLDQNSSSSRSSTNKSTEAYFSARPLLTHSSTFLLGFLVALLLASAVPTGSLSSESGAESQPKHASAVSVVTSTDATPKETVDRTAAPLTFSAPSTIVPDFPLSPIAQTQVANFRNGTGLLLNFHIVHHGGTTFCREMGKHLKAPSFACLHSRPEDHAGPEFKGNGDKPWTHNETGAKIEMVTNYFQYISWEWLHPQPLNHKPQIKDTNYEHPNLVSILVMRDPISRGLAGDGYTDKTYKTLRTPNTTLEEWWQFAKDDTVGNTNNYALRVLAGYPCCNGSHTDPIHLEHAKELVNRFTFVLDIACLNEGILAVAGQLGVNVSLSKAGRDPKRHQHKSNEERIPYPEVHQYLKEKNRLDIQLYEWSKTRAIVNCEKLHKDDP